MKIIYKFATRSRPDKFIAAVNNIRQYAKHKDYLIMVTADIDDPTMANETIRDFCNGSDIKIYYGNSESKVDAINRDMGLAPEWDILINMSDDMEFIMSGFDLQIISDYKTLPVGDVFLHYPDQAAGAALSTMSIMDKKYYDRFGYIYHPEYKSLFCDNEAQEVAKILGRYKFIKKRLFNHNHPAWGLCATDEQYVRTEGFHWEDKATYERRKFKNFYLV